MPNVCFHANKSAWFLEGHSGHDIPVKIIKANENFFAEAICFYFNKSLENGKFPNYLK